MRIALLLFFICVIRQVHAQELFVFTEPASNMAAKSIAARLTTTVMKEQKEENYETHFIPEIMWGASKKFMLHLEGFFNNKDKDFIAEGAAVYLKYRFYSVDEVHSHFRIASFIKASYNNSEIHQPAIDLNGNNSGYETGLNTTKLINKVALSATGAFVHAVNNGKRQHFPEAYPYRNAVSYTLSAGKLMLPANYTDYKQTNVNLMTEALGQTNLHSGKTYIDLAPSIQFIFLSKLRLDLGYRFPIINDLARTYSRGVLLKLEYNFFNVYK